MSDMEQLISDITSGERILFITGAGLSVASGLMPYRGDKNAIWGKFVLDWGTRRKFLKNPEVWWNRFWLQTHEKREYFEAKPNPGHYAIAAITHIANARVVTQNIDRLHSKTSINEDKLVEVHGRLGLYKCVTKDCKYSYEQSIDTININDYAINGTSLESNNLQITPPHCPCCGKPILPQSLLFDEMYTSHTFYKWPTVLDWLSNSDIMIFVGTSFSVGITQEALRIAKDYGIRTYNFNLYEEEVKDFPNMHHILGKCEVTLKTLAERLLYNRWGRPRLYYMKPYAELELEEEQTANAVIPASIT